MARTTRYNTCNIIEDLLGLGKCRKILENPVGNGENLRTSHLKNVAKSQLAPGTLQDTPKKHADTGGAFQLVEKKSGVALLKLTNIQGA